MSVSHTVVSKSSARIEALRAKHKHLSDKIKSEQNHPSVSEHLLTGLKRQKLKIKEQIEGIQEAS